MPWKSLNLSKLNAPDQNTRDRFAPTLGTAIPGGSGQQQAMVKTAENRRQKCYNNDGAQEELDDDLEEASRLLTLDDFAPNFISQKPFGYECCDLS